MQLLRSQVELEVAFPSQSGPYFDVFLEMSVQNEQTYVHGKHLFFPFVKTKMLCFLVLHFEGSNQCFSQVCSGSSRTTRKQTVTTVVAGGQRPWQASRLLSEDTALVLSAITSVARWFFTVAGHTRGTAVD